MAEQVSSKGRSVLREMGLTEYESRAYIFLLKVGVTTASHISKETNIPYSKIYEVLNSLQRKGWIESRANRPHRYYPKPPVNALEMSKLKFENMLREWQKSVQNDLQTLYEKREIREKPDVWIFHGEIDAVVKLKDLVGNAKQNLMIAIPNLTKHHLRILYDSIKKKSSKVLVLVMLSKTQEHLSKYLGSIGEVRFRDNMFGGGIIGDDQEVILMLGGDSSPLIIWSDHSGLVKFAKDYFQYLWRTAEKTQ